MELFPKWSLSCPEVLHNSAKENVDCADIICDFRAHMEEILGRPLPSTESCDFK